MLRFEGILTPIRAMGRLLVLVLATLLPAAAHAGEVFGPAFSQFSLTLESGQRTEAVGPLYYRQTTEWGNTLALPPLFSKFEAPDLSRTEIDFAYPLLTYDRDGTEWRWQLFQLLSFDGSADQSAHKNRQFTLFPFYFQQLSDDPKQTYHALFPIYGHLQRRLFRSEIDFVLWPLYVKTTRYATINTNGEASPPLGIASSWFTPRSGEVTTYNYVYPFFHLRYGDGLRGWQFWPVTGHELKVVTTKTNSWGDAETIPGHEKRFVLWPFYFDETRGIGSTNIEKQWTLLPLYSQMRSPRRDSTSYGWPFGVIITDDREKKYHEVDALWPLVVFAHGEGKTARRIWPLFSQAHNDTVESDFYLWPLYKYNRLHSGALDRDRTRILLFLYSHVNEKNTETGKAKHRSDFWPLYTHQTDFNGNSRLQILAPLEPILPASKSIARDYSPIWSLWRSEHNPTTHAASQSLLWNLYRHERAGVDKKCSLLFGLFQYQSGATGGNVKLFYLPLGATKTKPQPPADADKTAR
ncbi:MAG: hypothetical protein EPO07_10355 [Verrucomicrobia bacterium]|nr:MAG: hypothetical protein EPO07_10355 [Verrucomicrobiota bacterium]